MNRSAWVTRGPEVYKCLFNQSKRLDRNPQHVPGGAWGLHSRDAMRNRRSSLLQLCCAAPAQKSGEEEPDRRVKWEVRVCEAGSQDFIPDVWSLLLFSCLTEQPDRMMGLHVWPPWAGAQALLWVLIIHHTGPAFIPLMFGWLKPIRNTSSVPAGTRVCVRSCVLDSTRWWDTNKGW